MYYLHDAEVKIAMKYIDLAAYIAQSATCTRSQCGSVIVKNDIVIGAGYNSPPYDREGERRCACDKRSFDFKVTDKTCCIHAEQRAIMDALKNNPNDLDGSRLYFIRLSEDGFKTFA